MQSLREDDWGIEDIRGRLDHFVTTPLNDLLKLSCRLR